MFCPPSNGRNGPRLEPKSSDYYPWDYYRSPSQHCFVGEAKEPSKREAAHSTPRRTGASVRRRLAGNSQRARRFSRATGPGQRHGSHLRESDRARRAESDDPISGEAGRCARRQRFRYRSTNGIVEFAPRQTAAGQITKFVSDEWLLLGIGRYLLFQCPIEQPLNRRSAALEPVSEAEIVDPLQKIRIDYEV